MGRTVGELLDSMDAAEFVHWIAYQDIDPITDDRADLRAGIVASVVANCLTNKHDFKPTDFLPQYGKAPAEEMTEDELQLAGLKLVALMGGTVSEA